MISSTFIQSFPADPELKLTAGFCTPEGEGEVDVAVSAEVNENAGLDDVSNQKGELAEEQADNPNENPVDSKAVDAKEELLPEPEEEPAPVEKGKPEAEPKGVTGANEVLPPELEEEMVPEEKETPEFVPKGAVDAKNTPLEELTLVENEKMELVPKDLVAGIADPNSKLAKLEEEEPVSPNTGWEDNFSLLEFAEAVVGKNPLSIETEDVDRDKEPLLVLENNCDSSKTEELLLVPMLENTDDVAEAELLLPVLENATADSRVMELLMPKDDALIDFPSKSLESDWFEHGVTKVEAPVEALEPNWNDGTTEHTVVADEIVGLPELVLVTMLVEKTEVTGLSGNDMAGAAEIIEAKDSEPLLSIGVADAPKANRAGLVELDSCEEAAFPNDWNTSPVF
ncbi:hypothetical protein COCNU_scaffold000955G000010 [Cocos nucifera]|nr:hypothetical protein [Cocos nucifera]